MQPKAKALRVTPLYCECQVILQLLSLYRSYECDVFPTALGVTAAAGEKDAQAETAGCYDSDGALVGTGGETWPHVIRSPPHPWHHRYPVQYTKEQHGQAGQAGQAGQDGPSEHEARGIARR